MCRRCLSESRLDPLIECSTQQSEPLRSAPKFPFWVHALLFLLTLLLCLAVVQCADGQTVSPEIQPAHGAAGDPQTATHLGVHKTRRLNASENRAFWIVTGIDYAATFADAAVSSRSHFRPGAGACHEGNPLFGTAYPSPQRLWLSMTATTTGIAAVSWALKRRHHDWFVVAPLADALVHATLAGSTAGRCLP